MNKQLTKTTNKYYRIVGKLIIDNPVQAHRMTDIRVDIIVYSDTPEHAKTTVLQNNPTMRFEKPPKIYDVSHLAENEYNMINDWNDGSAIHLPGEFEGFGLFEAIETEHVLVRRETSREHHRRVSIHYYNADTHTALCTAAINVDDFTIERYNEQEHQSRLCQNCVTKRASLKKNTQKA